MQEDPGATALTDIEPDPPSQRPPGMSASLGPFKLATDVRLAALLLLGNTLEESGVRTYVVRTLNLRMPPGGAQWFPLTEKDPELIVLMAGEVLATITMGEHSGKLVIRPGARVEPSDAVEVATADEALETVMGLRVPLPKE